MNSDRNDCLPISRRVALTGTAFVLGVAAALAAGEVAYSKDGTVPAAKSYNPVRQCLDQVQLNLARKTAPAFHVTSHAVQNPPKDLPIECLAGNLDEIKSALK